MPKFNKSAVKRRNVLDCLSEPEYVERVETVKQSGPWSSLGAEDGDRVPSAPRTKDAHNARI